MKKGFRQMLAEAEAEIETLPAPDAAKLHGDPAVVFVDLRDPRTDRGGCRGGYPGLAGRECLHLRAR